jgi:hypothetical protein
MKLADVEAILRALNDANVRYLIVGGLAVIAHGYVRLTLDADIVLDLSTENVRRAMDALEAIGYRPLVPVVAAEFADEEKRRKWIEEKRMIVFQMHNPSRESTRLDIFVSEPFPFYDAYGKALWEEVARVRAPIVPYEQLIRLKRAAGRSQDLIDVEHLETIRRARST